MGLSQGILGHRHHDMRTDEGSVLPGLPPPHTINNNVYTHIVRSVQVARTTAVLDMLYF